MIGYGGAALAIHYAFETKGFKKINIFNRSKKILKYSKIKKYTLKINQLDKYLPNADLLINTTPLNPIHKSKNLLITKKTLISDIVYLPKQTKFLKNFPENKKVYGISMLLEQAVPCFKLWFGFSPTIDQKLQNILENKIK